MKRKLFGLLSVVIAIFACTFGLTACKEDPALRFTLSDDGTYYICEYGNVSKAEAEMVIPSVYNGKPVEEIGHFHFDNLESVTIPDSVKVIGEQAFSGCSNLKNVTIGSGVTTIGKSAFGGCNSLESITLPDNVTTIEESAFEQCHNLKNVTLGKGVKTIKGHTFYHSENLKNIVLPDTVEVIADNAFTGCGLESITIGSGVTTIGKYAFRDCKLKTVELPSSVSTIDDRAFCNCSSLETVVLDGKEKITFGDTVFYGCTSFKTIYAKSTLEEWRAAENSSPESIAWYSETTPPDDAYYWHYVDGIITNWN
ncbi:MAG: leucine-rich repeat domain-containing protein [Clostridia bacterium]|nr:leucine-rich repeat domain-containing protein [Clostridia bacterium]